MQKRKLFVQLSSFRGFGGREKSSSSFNIMSPLNPQSRAHPSDKSFRNKVTEAPLTYWSTILAENHHSFPQRHLAQLLCWWWNEKHATLKYKDQQTDKSQKNPLSNPNFSNRTFWSDNLPLSHYTWFPSKQSQLKNYCNPRWLRAKRNLHLTNRLTVYFKRRRWDFRTKTKK